MLQLDWGSQSCFRLQNDFTNIPSVVSVTAGGVLLPGHVHTACLCLLEQIWLKERNARRTERWLRGEQWAADFWTLSTVLAYLKAEFFFPSLNITDSILNEERWYTNLGIGGDSVKGRSDILSPAATRCWCSRGKYTIINHTPRSQIRHQEKMVLLIQEKTSQVLKYGILLKSCQGSNMCYMESTANYLVFSIQGKTQVTGIKSFPFLHTLETSSTKASVSTSLRRKPQQL